MTNLSALFQRSIEIVGMTCSACGMVTGPKAVSANPFHFTNWPPAWMELYISSGFLDIDPLPRYAIASGTAATWSEIISKISKHDPGFGVIATAAAWGFTEGMVVPLRNSVGDLGLVSMGGRRGVLNPDEADFLKILSNTAFCMADSLTAEYTPASVRGIFTAREAECIHLLHQGLTDQEIAHAIGVGIVTVRSHIEKARKKVNARSRTHLASLTVAHMTGLRDEPAHQAPQIIAG